LKLTIGGDMALIACPECHKQVSTRAASCPNCGCPISRNELEVAPAIVIERPTLAGNVEIGKQIVNWLGTHEIKGYCSSEENPEVGIPDGKVRLTHHKCGVRLSQASGLVGPTLKDIHFSQFLSIEYVARSRVYESGKSVIKRAAVGSLILGPLGAAVGGMSGIGMKQERFKGYIILNFWGVAQNYPLSIMIALNNDSAARDFCALMKEEAKKVRKELDKA
jgi:RNA polymerase subunit RPABC4/transcription elongation factor Spt4